MVFEYMDNNNITNLGCVIILENELYLFSIDDDQNITPSILLDNDDITIDTLKENEMLIISISVNYNGKFIQFEEITNDIQQDVIINIDILSIYTLQTNGLIFDDIYDFNFLDELIIDKIDEYLQSKI